MSSPYVRRLRLGLMLRDLREKVGWTQQKLVDATGLSRQIISRLENADRVADLDHVMTILDALDIPLDSPTCQTVIRVTRDSNRRGWWQTREYKGMGERHRRVADLESGAVEIREYHNVLTPGLAQTEAYARHRVRVGDGDGPDFDVEASVRARLRRQQEILAPNAATTYRLVLEELAIRRPVVPAEVMVEQLRHLLALAERPNIDIRVLPIEAHLGDVYLPRTPFAIFVHDIDDPLVTLVDTVEEDLLEAGTERSRAYARLFDRLWAAVLPEADSAAFIQQVAAKVATEA